MVFESRNSKIVLFSVLAFSLILAAFTLVVLLPNNEADYTCIMILLRLSQERKTSKKTFQKTPLKNLRKKKPHTFSGPMTDAQV